jgi:hypothetical protein
MPGTSIPFFLFATGSRPPAPGGLTLVFASTEPADVVAFNAHATVGAEILTLAAGSLLTYAQSLRSTQLRS